MKKVLYYLIIMLAFTLNACDNEMDICKEVIKKS